MWIVPSTSCPSVPASADSTLPSTWLFRRLARCAGLNGKPTAWRSWRRAWKKAPWLRRLCGRISRPSTARRGVESWIASLAAGPVSHSPWPANRLGRTIRDTFGLTSLESLARFVPPSPFSKTYRGTLLLDSIPFSESFETWATELRRLSLLRRKSAQAIEGSGCSSWPTASVTNAPRGSGREKKANGKVYEHLGKTLASEAEQNWPTAQSQTWKTPHGMGNFDKEGKVGGAGGGEFAKQANQWPTPNVPNRGPESKQSKATRPDSGGIDLQTEAAQWPTPRSAEYKECGPEGSKSHEHRLDRKYLDATAQSFHPSPPAPASSTNGGESSKSRRRLNPLFVCWLMGFPIGWGHADLNGFGPTAMRSYLCRQRMLLSSLLRRWSEE